MANEREPLERSTGRVRAPVAALRPYVASLWTSEARGCVGEFEALAPNGAAHLAIRMRDEAVRIVEGGVVRDTASAVVCGPRTRAHVKVRARPVEIVGVQFEACGAALLFGRDAVEFAERHAPLVEAWGASGEALVERLREDSTADARLDRIEAFLLARLARLARLRRIPRLALFAAPLLARGARVERVVESSGYSHRRFVELFKREVGLAPKAFAGVARVDRALRSLASGATIAEAAQANGFSDQPHLQRDVRRALGLTPRDFVAAAVEHARHVPLAIGQLPSIQRARSTLESNA